MAQPGNLPTGGSASVQHIIETVFRTRGWDAYREKVNRSGKVTEQAWTKAIRRGKELETTVLRAKNGVVSFSRSTKMASTQMSDFTRAMRRALIVAPIWMAIRNAMQLVIGTLSAGAKAWIDFDRMVQKSTQVIHGQAGTIAEAVGRLKDEVQRLSLETGQSLDSLTGAFYRFGTVGNKFEASLDGMRTASRLAILMFGDTEQIARTLAQAYRLLGDTVNSAIPPHERMNVIGAQIYKLWKTNAFEIGELAAAFEKFLPTANVMNINLEDSIALLASLQTAGLRGSRAGRLLRTSINKLVESAGDLASELGVSVNPRLDSTSDVLFKVLAAIKELDQAGQKFPIEVFEKLGIFGGVRSKEAAAGLIALYDAMLENRKAINVEEGKFNQLLLEQELAYDDIKKSLSFQEQRFKNLKTLVGKAFVEGITGSEDFAASLADINRTLEAMIPLLKDTGENIRGFADHMATFLDTIMAGLPQALADLGVVIETLTIDPIIDQLNEAMRGKLNIVELEELLRKLETPEIIGRFRLVGADPDQAIKNLKKLIARVKTEVQRELGDLAEEPSAIAAKEGIATAMDIPVKDLEKKLRKFKQDQLKFFDDLTKEYNKLKVRQIEVAGLRAGKTQLQIQKDIYEWTRKTITLNEIERPKEMQRMELEIQRLEAQRERKRLLDSEVDTARRLEVLGYSAIAIEQKRLELMLQRGANEEELYEQQRKIMQATTDAIDEQAQKLSGMFKDLLKGTLKGEQVDALSTLREGLLDMFAESFSTRLTSALEQSGIFEKFGGLFAELEDPVIKAGRVNANLWEQSIVRAGSQVAQMWAGAITGGQPGMIGGIPGILPQVIQGVPIPPGLGAPAGALGYVQPPIAGVGFGYTPYAQQQNVFSPTNRWSQMGFMGRVGGIFGAGMAGYQAYQAGGMASGAMAGIGSALMTFGGVPGAILGGIMMLGSLFTGKKKRVTTVTEEERELRVASKIDITNKQLEIVNRNLVAIRKGFEGFILPSSAYFGSRAFPNATIEDILSSQINRGVA